MTVFAVAGPPEIQVKIQVGRVDIVATDRGDVVVTVSPSNPAARATGPRPSTYGSIRSAEPSASWARPG